MTDELDAALADLERWLNVTLAEVARRRAALRPALTGDAAPRRLVDVFADDRYAAPTPITSRQPDDGARIAAVFPPDADPDDYRPEDA